MAASSAVYVPLDGMNEKTMWSIVCEPAAERAAFYFAENCARAYSLTPGGSGVFIEP